MNNNKATQTGFTLIELMVVIIILGILAAIIGSGVFTALVGGNIFPAQKEAQAQSNLAITLEQLGVAYKGAVCSGEDTDGDRAVTCTVNLQEGQTALYSCPYSGFTWSNKICKANPYTQFQ